MKLTALTAAAAILGAGCAFEPADHPDPARAAAEDEAPPWQVDDAAGYDQHDQATTIALRTDSTVAVARVSDGGIVGGDVNLGRFAEGSSVAVRGRAFGRIVSLDASGGRVTGNLGGHPVDLAVARHGGVLHVEGLTRGGPSSFAISARTFRGNIGRCAYELTRGPGGYAGRRSCGRGTEQALLRVPPLLACWSDEARVAALAVLLGS